MCTGHMNEITSFAQMDPFVLFETSVRSSHHTCFPSGVLQALVYIFWTIRDICSYSVSHGKKKKRKGKLLFFVYLLSSSINFIILVSHAPIRELRLQAPEDTNSADLNKKGTSFITYSKTQKARVALGMVA